MGGSVNEWRLVIKDALKQKKITISQIGPQLGLTRVSFHLLLQKRTYKKKTLIKLCTILDLDIFKMLEIDYRLTMKGE